jgi:hypothetical protein
MHRRTSSTGDSHLRDPSSGGSGPRGPFWPKIPQVQSFESSKAISMRWSRRCRSNQLNHATRRTSSTGETPICREGPIQWWQWSHEAHLAKTPPQFNIIWIDPSHLRWSRRCRSNQLHVMPQERTPVLGRLHPPGPIQWWQWSLMAEPAWQFPTNSTI